MRQDEAKRNLDNDKSIKLVDVRNPREYADGHIPGSILIPLDSLNSTAEELLPEKTATIYVYCRSGSRSAMGAKLLNSLGYTHVYNIGGITTWPYEVEKGR